MYAQGELGNLGDPLFSLGDEPEEGIRYRKVSVPGEV